MSDKTAVVLFGHGARDPDWAKPMHRALEMVQARSPDLLVELAFLEFMTPSLAEAIDKVVAQGAARVTVIPMFLAQGGHLKKDVPLLVGEARQRYPACDIRQALAVGEMDEVIAAMADHAVSSAIA